jgi:hypothetical protein
MRTTTVRSTSRSARTTETKTPATTPAVAGALAGAIERLTAKPRRKAGELRHPAVLSIGLAPSREFSGIAMTRAASPREVIEMLRIMEFNLLLVSATAEDSAIWNLMGVIQRHWPELRWVLITDDCSNQEEIMARSLGAASVTSDPRVIAELANYR